MKVLVVDDVALVLRQLANFLEQQNFKVLTTRSPVEALDMLKRDNRISVVLTDLVMPNMDGIELFKAANKIERLDDDGTAPQPKFILMTAARPDRTGESKVSKQLQEAIDLGFVDIIFKPFNYDKLVKLICKAGQAEMLGSYADSANRAGAATHEAISRLKELVLQIDRSHEQLQEDVDTLQARCSRLQDGVSEARKLVSHSLRLLGRWQKEAEAP